MSLLNKANNKFPNRARHGQGTGRLGTGNQSRQAEGPRDQGKADLKDAGEKIKDAFKKQPALVDTLGSGPAGPDCPPHQRNRSLSARRQC